VVPRRSSHSASILLGLITSRGSGFKPPTRPATPSFWQHGHLCGNSAAGVEARIWAVLRTALYILDTLLLPVLRTYGIGLPGCTTVCSVQPVRGTAAGWGPWIGGGCWRLAGRMLLLLLLVVPSPAHGCTSDTDCYGGRCRAGACVCPPMWRGPRCAALNLAPAELHSGLRVANTSSWGGGIIEDTSSNSDDPADHRRSGHHRWHLYAALFINNCGLKSWTSNSEIVHAVSSHVEGPYALVSDEERVVIPTFAHNPTVERLGDDNFVLAHIGCGNGSKAPVSGCTNGTTCNTSWCEPNVAAEEATAGAGASRAGGRSCDTPHFSGMHRARQPAGPWRAVDLSGSSLQCGIEVDGGTAAWHSPCITNPQFHALENGSVLLAYSTGCANCTTSVREARYLRACLHGERRL
jgi:hypothetical protein